MTRVGLVLFALYLSTAPLALEAAPQSGLRRGAKVYVAEMNDGFHDFFKAALQKKRVPVVVVDSKAEAEFEITGSSDSQKAGAAKKIFIGSWHSDEQASISVANLSTGEVVFAYAANKKNSAHGKQTTAEACAKHLKDELERKR